MGALLSKNKLKTKSKYVERGAAIKVPQDDFFLLLRSSFRLNDPDKTRDSEILKLSAKRLQMLMGNEESLNFESAEKKIFDFQNKLTEIAKERSFKILDPDELFPLHLERVIIGLVAYSAVDRDLARLYRQLQSKSKLARMSDANVDSLTSLLTRINNRFNWKMDRFNQNLPMHKQAVEAHPYSLLKQIEPLLQYDIKNSVKSVIRASKETWDTTGLTLYKSSGKVPRPYFTKCFYTLEKLAEICGYKAMLIHEIYRDLGVKTPQSGITENTTVGLKTPLGCPVSQELDLQLALSAATLLTK